MNDSLVISVRLQMGCPRFELNTVNISSLLAVFSLTVDGKYEIYSTYFGVTTQNLVKVLHASTVLHDSSVTT